MKIIQEALNGVIVLEPKAFTDSRGYFYESFSLNRYREAGINYDFVQDNVSRSVKGTVRGLHYQVGKSSQGKLCQVLHGKVIDVAVDIRFGSPTYGKYVAAELSSENHHQIWIPPGFAHGFSVLSDETVFHYKCTNFYNAADERGIIYNDKDINIDWKVENPLVSEKDLKGKLFKDIEKDFIY